MALRQRIWAHKRKRYLIGLMGKVCAICGRKSKRFEFHHPVRKPWRANRIEHSWRMSIYYREWLEGNLELLCLRCHRKVTGRQLSKPNEPF